MNQVTSIDPRTGAVRAAPGPETTRSELDAICAQAASPFSEMRGRDRAWRAVMLHAIADALEAVREPLVERAG